MGKSMEQVLPQSKVIKDFISEITKNWNEVGQPLLEIRSISASGSTNAARFRLDQIDEAVQHAEAMNNAKANIYMCINAIDPILAENIPAGKAAKDTDIMAAFYCFADADTKGAMENIMSFAGPKFTMSVKTDDAIRQRPRILGAGRAMPKHGRMEGSAEINCRQPPHRPGSH